MHICHGLSWVTLKESQGRLRGTLSTGDMQRIAGVLGLVALCSRFMGEGWSMAANPERRRGALRTL